jgi:hypothetical protein
MKIARFFFAQIALVMLFLLAGSTRSMAQVYFKIGPNIKKEVKDGKLTLSSAKPMKVLIPGQKEAINIGKNATPNCPCNDTTLSDTCVFSLVSMSCEGSCCSATISHGNSILKIPSSGGGGGITVIIDNF